MPNSRNHIQLFRNPSAVTMSDSTELLMGEPAVGLKPFHERIFVNDSQGNLTTLSSDFALMSLQESAGIRYNPGTDEFTFKTELSNATSMSEFLEETAFGLKDAVPLSKCDFKLNIVSGQPQVVCEVDRPVNTIVVSKKTNDTLTPIYSGYGQTVVCNTTIDGTEEEYVVHYSPGGTSGMVIEENYFVYTCGVVTTSASTLDENTNAVMTFFTTTGNSIKTHCTTNDNEYIWLLVPSMLQLKKTSNQNIAVVLDNENISTLELTNGTFNCYRTLNRLIECDWDIEMTLAGRKKTRNIFTESLSGFSNEYKEFLLETNLAYGVQWDKTATDPDCTRIGNMKLHAVLPVQSQMKGCLLNDGGEVVKYLNPDTWENEVLDGSMGQVMVELPEFWWKFSENGNIQSVMLSHVPLEGYKKVNKSYISAYEATIDRGGDASGGTRYRDEWKMASVKNSSTRYRGGNNTASFDSTYKSQLGMAATYMYETFARNAARRRKPSTCEWNFYPYQQHKEIVWLFVVEYATRNSQKPVSATTTEEGYKQGGLGSGVTTVPGGWASFNGNYPFAPIGYTDSLGNGTGEVEYTCYSGDNEVWQIVNIPRYRGIENPFGHLRKSCDGVLVAWQTGDTKIYLSDNPSNWNSETLTGYKYIGNATPNNGLWIKEVFFGENGDIWATESAGNSQANENRYFCDKYTGPTSGGLIRAFFVGGEATAKTVGGLFHVNTSQGTGGSSSNTGYRLSFIPSKELNV